MNLNMFDLVKGGDVQIALAPSDFGAAANNGAWASVKNVKRVHVLLALGAGTGVEHVTLELEQAQDSVGTGAKPLNITKLYYKTGASLPAVAAWTEATAITRAASVASYVTSGAGAATLQHAYVIVVDEDDLDNANGFTHFRFKCADPGAARTGVCLYVADAMGYQGVAKTVLLAS
jgi:hypothetical protein